MRVNKIYYTVYVHVYKYYKHCAPSAPDRMIHTRPIRVLSTRKIGRTPAGSNSHDERFFRRTSTGSRRRRRRTASEHFAGVNPAAEAADDNVIYT